MRWQKREHARGQSPPGERSLPGEVRLGGLARGHRARVEHGRERRPRAVG